MSEWTPNPNEDAAEPPRSPEATNGSSLAVRPDAQLAEREETPMETADREKTVRALRAIEKRVTHVLHGPPVHGTEQGTAYLVSQVRGIRALLAEQDPTVALLFPELPDGLSLAELAIIAGQLAEYADENDAGSAMRPNKTDAATGRVVNVSLDIGDGVLFGENGVEEVTALLHGAVAKAAEDGDADTMNVSIDIGDGVVFSVPKAGSVGEMARKAVKKAMEGLENYCERGPNGITIRMGSAECEDEEEKG